MGYRKVIEVETMVDDKPSSSQATKSRPLGPDFAAGLKAASLFNPMKTTARFFEKYVIDLLAGALFLGDLVFNDGLYDTALSDTDNQFEEILRRSKLLTEIDTDHHHSTGEILERLSDQKDRREWLAFLGRKFRGKVEEALRNNDIRRAIWAAACIERVRAAIIFKDHFEEVIWQAQSLGLLIDVLHIWEENKENTSEQFWQELFKKYTHIISQIFATPVLFIRENAYVGGMTVDRKNAKFVDFLYSSETSHEVVLVEIKTPMTNLLGKKYRKIYKPSSDLSGAVVQVLEYRCQIAKNIDSIGKTNNISAFNPKCVLIVGNSDQLKNDNKKIQSFELFRSNSKDVEIITFDELFIKVRMLIDVINIPPTEAHYKKI